MADWKGLRKRRGVGHRKVLTKCEVGKLGNNFMSLFFRNMANDERNSYRS